MARKPLKIYWDSCAWLGLINGEADKKRELEIVYGHGRQGHYELWTSSLALVETRRLKDEEKPSRPWSEENEKVIVDLFAQQFIKVIPLSIVISNEARKIFRTTPGLGKWQDAIHLASALQWNLQVLHTYDHDDLLHLSGKFKCANGQFLTICYPDETTDGPLFGKIAN